MTTVLGNGHERVTGVDVPVGVLRQVEEAVLGAIQASSSCEGSVWIVERNVLRPVLAIGPDAAAYLELSLPLSPGSRTGVRKPRALHIRNAGSLKAVPRAFLDLARAFGVDVELALERVQFLASRGLRSLAVAPILSGRGVIGLIIVASEHADHYDKKALRYLRALSSQLGVALQSRALLQEETSRLELLEAYGTASALIAGTVRVDEALARIAESAPPVASCTDCAVYLWNDESERLVGVAASPAYRDAVTTTPIGLEEDSAVAEAFENQKAVVYEDVGAIPCTLPEGRCLACRLGMKAMVAMPLSAVGESVGVLVVSDARGPRPFSDEELDRLRVLADHAAVAIQQARLAQALEERELELRHLSDELIQAHEEERRGVAREIHDGVAQSMAALALEMALADTCMHEHKLTEVEQHCQNALRIRDETAESVRRISDELRPRILDEMGLVPALRWHCREVAERTGLDVVFDGTDRGDVDPAAALALYRVAQEALANAARHAGAQHVSVRLRRTSRRLELTVVDDGKGFDPNERRLHPRGIGLLGMRERVRQLQGDTTVMTEPGQGTTVTVALPANPEGREASA